MSSRDLQMLTGILLQTVDEIVPQDAGAEATFLASIERNKLEQNLAYARKLLTELELNQAFPAFSPARKRLREVQDKLQGVDELLEQRAADAWPAAAADGADGADSADSSWEHHSAQSEYESLLRHRAGAADTSTGAASNASSERTLEERLDLHRDMQSDLAASLLQHTQQLKSNAITLGEKLATDKDVVDNAGRALEKNVTGMKRTEDRLKDYRNLRSVGLKFYALAVVVVFVSLFVGILVTKILPKW
ncbi:uncharacterized protein V1510DRAFT_394300 [Dipodascopsis tothii]|uniref:uncharacterized protein n=1 Tax=Dipodascopsis tothii TaxID=44089 RepID=UPI0034CFF08C